MEAAQSTITSRAADYDRLRQEYPEFHYNNYTVREDAEAIYLQYDFAVPGLAEFHPELKLLKKQLALKSLDSPLVQNLAFHIGLVELVSYWKATCSPRVIIKCGGLTPEQVVWWKKLYFNGLGELFYTNGIAADFADFMAIEATGEPIALPETAGVASAAAASNLPESYLVLIGGGKDSIVTLETLGMDAARDYALIVNPKPVTRRCAELAGLTDNHVIEVYRRIDPALLDLNQRGFLNGHTPFSTMLAFVSYFVAYLAGITYTVVSNESSANESSVAGTNVNHQYSKSFEFEHDFTDYAARYLGAPVWYFSFLRPLNELQIAKIFARLSQYHDTFKSCNVGSKGAEWYWCGQCAKCLFAFIILAPYLYRERLVEIFDQDLFAKADLVETMLELAGYRATKPFDCVGTVEEVRFALSRVIQDLQTQGQPLPYLLQYYVDHYPLADTAEDLTARYNFEHGLNEAQNQRLRAEVFRNV